MNTENIKILEDIYNSDNQMGCSIVIDCNNCIFYSPNYELRQKYNIYFNCQDISYKKVKEIAGTILNTLKLELI